MASRLLTSHAAPAAACRARFARRRRPGVGARLATLAIVAVALAVMFYGERWMLEQSPAAVNEMIVATCVLDVVYGDDDGSSTACTACANSRGNAL